MSSQRLQKVLAQAGVASRRAAETLITEGRVRVNGRIVRELGARANLHKDRVEVDGRRLVAQRHVYFLMHKPRGVVTTLDDPEGRKTVKDLLRSINERVFPVGRLDFQTSGALLLTNDGDLAQALLHPTRAVPKTYNAKLEGKLDEERLNALRAGVVLDDGHKTAPADVHILRTDDKATSVEITIAEGKNRQIHRMGEAIGRAVLRLTRISFAGLTLEGLRPGQLRPLTARELTDLKETYLHKAPKRRKHGRSYGAEAYEEASGQLSFSSVAAPDEHNAWGSEEEPSWGDDDGVAEAPESAGPARRGVRAGVGMRSSARRSGRSTARGPTDGGGAHFGGGDDDASVGDETQGGANTRRGGDTRFGARRGGNARRGDEAARGGQTERGARVQGTADSGNEYAAPQRKTRGAGPRNAQSRSTRGADPRGEYGSQARKTRGADPRGDYGSPARKTRGADPRGEDQAQPRKTRGADPRGEYGSRARKSRGADPRGEYGGQSVGSRGELTSPRKTRGADPRGEYGSQARKTRGEDQAQPRKTRGADPRGEYGSRARKTRGADPRNEYGSQPRKKRVDDARNEQGARSRKVRGADPRNEYGAQPRKVRGADPRELGARGSRNTKSSRSRTAKSKFPRAKKPFKR